MLGFVEIDRVYGLLLVDEEVSAVGALQHLYFIMKDLLRLGFQFSHSFSAKKLNN